MRGNIKNKLIRCVGSIKRLKEDSLRIIRAIRFNVIYNFELDKDIQKCLDDDEYIKLLKNVSNERIKAEIQKCFNYNTINLIIVFII